MVGAVLRFLGCVLYPRFGFGFGLGSVGTLFFHTSGCLALDGIVRVGEDGVCKGHEFCLM